MAMSGTAPAQYAAWSAGELPPVEQVRDGLWSVPVPMPGYGLRYLLSYVLELPDGIAVIDTGWPTDDAWDGLVTGLSAVGFRPADVRAVLSTHGHSDHYGLTGRVREASGAWIGLHPSDTAIVTAPSRRRWWHELRPRLGLQDVPMPAAGAVDTVGAMVAEPLAEPDVALRDGELVDLDGWRLRTVWTPGHSPGHVCFHDEGSGLLLAGDHVLPKISPSVTVTRMNAQPLGDYLLSLRRTAELDVTEVLPAHEYRYHDLRQRVDELLSHHKDRLDEILTVLADHPEPTVLELARRLSWSRPLADQPPVLRRTALLETLAHLELLRARGTVIGVGDRPERWSATSSTGGRR